MAGLGINKDSLSWHEPSDGPYYFEYMDQGLETKLERPIMYRVNDVPTALRSLKPDAALSGQFTIGVDDPIVSTNVGPWEVGFRDGSVTVEHTKRSSQPGLKMSIRHFTQAFLGEPSLLQLADAEYIDVESKRELGAAATILPAQATYCLDFF